MSEDRKLPPIWWMGLTNATFGIFGGFAVVTLPEMLAAQGISGGRIASIVAAVLAPGFFLFLFAPALDVRFSRRTYALGFSVVAAAALAFTVLRRTNVGQIEVAMVIGYIAATMAQSAIGGWVGSLVGKEQDSELGTWFALSNIGSGGLMVVVAGELIHALPRVGAAVAIAGIQLLPSLLYVRIPAPGPDRRLASESFAQFFREIAALVKRREVLVALTMFMLPSASFALTNVLGGIGKDFNTGERMVSILAGVGAAVAGVAGSLLLRPLAKRMTLRPLYLAIGVAGGVFTLGLLLLPHNSTTFAIAITGENVFQALAFAASNAITFETIGRDNPLAATQFSLLLAASNLSIIYMGYVDGRGYERHGVPGAFVADAALSMTVCVGLAVGLAWLRRRGWAGETA